MKVGLVGDFKSTKVRKYRGKKDVWDRFAILDEQVEFELVHFVPGSGYVLCTMSRFRECQFCKYLTREPMERYATNICIYTTADDGQPFQPLQFDIQWWPFPEKTYQQLKVWKKNCGDLRSRDIMSLCTEERYQNLQLSLMNDAWWLLNDEFREQVAKEFKERSVKDLSVKIGTLVPLENQIAIINGSGQPSNAVQSQPNAAPNFNPATAVSAATNPPQLPSPSTATGPSFAPTSAPVKPAAPPSNLPDLSPVMPSQPLDSVKPPEKDPESAVKVSDLTDLDSLLEELPS